MNILLADNERIIRLGLISMLDELYPNKNQYIHATNGQEMIEMAAVFQPDIGFADIRMPLMDGLSALKIAREKCPSTQWVILTGYADFEYAQRAVLLGAKDYLLKPVSLQQMKDLMTRLQADIEKQRGYKNKLFTASVISAVITGQKEEPEYQLANYELFLCYFDHWEKEIRIAAQSQLKKFVNIYFENTDDKSRLVACFYLPTGEFCIITGSDRGELHLNGMSVILKRMDYEVTVLYGKADDLAAAGQMIRCFLDMARIRCVRKFGKIIDPIYDSKAAVFLSLMKFSKQIENLCLAYLQRDYWNFDNTLAELERSLEYRDIYRDVELASLQRYMQAVTGITVDTTSFDTFCSKLREDYKNLNKVQPATDIIDEVKVFIEQNYMNGIGLDSIGEQFDISPSYLSRLFHQRTGDSFINYVTSTRISHAKRLLLVKPPLSISDISVQVGYYSVQHFTKTFLKRTGLTPSQFRKKHSLMT